MHNAVSSLLTYWRSH